MKPTLSGRWAETPSSQRREPTSPEIANGFPCGPWDQALFNELMFRLTDLAAEAGNAITGSGLSLSASDAQQLLRAIRSQRANFVPATGVGGTANAITLAFSPTFANVADLIGTPIRFVAKAAPTGAVTVTTDGLPPQSLVWALDGTAIANGDYSIGAELEIAHDGTAFRLLSALSPSKIAALRLSQPYLGFEGGPVSQSITSGAVTRINSYTGIVNNLPGATHSAGIITIGTTGKYIVSANHNALLPDVVGGAYGYSTSISKVDAGGAPIASIAAQPSEWLSASSFSGSRAGSVTALTRLAAGDRIAAFLGHNRGANVSVSISIDIEFRGV